MRTVFKDVMNLPLSLSPVTLSRSLSLSLVSSLSLSVSSLVSLSCLLFSSRWISSIEEVCDGEGEGMPLSLSLSLSKCHLSKYSQKDQVSIRSQCMSDHVWKESSQKLLHRRNDYKNINIWFVLKAFSKFQSFFRKGDEDNILLMNLKQYKIFWNLTP